MSVQTNALARAPRLIELNEDLIAACLENLQLGRFDECIHHYSLLQQNLIALGLEIDNYPLNDEDPAEALKMFPDEIVRKDILEELRQPSDLAELRIPQAPPPPPCAACFAQNLSSYICRIRKEHTDPSCKFSPGEKQDFLAVLQVLENRQRQLSQGSGRRRIYQRWSPDERHSLLVALNLFGTKNQGKLVEFLEPRNENQVRSFISKAFEGYKLGLTLTRNCHNFNPKCTPGTSLRRSRVEPNCLRRLSGMKLLLGYYRNCIHVLKLGKI